MLDAAVSLTNQVGAPHYEAAARRVYGQYWLQEGDLSEAEEWLNQSIAIAKDLGSRVELGRSYYALARVLAQAGDRPSARENAVLAKELFETCGVKRYLGKAESLLRSIEAV